MKQKKRRKLCDESLKQFNDNVYERKIEELAKVNIQETKPNMDFILFSYY